MQFSSHQQTYQQNPNIPQVIFQYQPNPKYNVEVKSTFSSNKPKTIQIIPHQNKFVVYHQKNQQQQQKQQNSYSNYRQFPLDQIRYRHSTPDKNGNQKYLHIDTNQGKKYTIKATNEQQHNKIIKSIQKGQQFNRINNLPGQQQSLKQVIPKHYEYKNIPINITPLQSGMMNIHKNILSRNIYQSEQNYNQLTNMQHHSHQHHHRQGQHVKVMNINANNNENKGLSNKQVQIKHARRKSFINFSDWKLDNKKGGLIFINQQKKKNQSKILKFIIKKFLSTGSFMGISFPTFAMKPQSILQTYGKACGSAPILFQTVSNAVQRIKKVICFIHSFSIIFADMQKPFNPVLGQTYQCMIADGMFSSEQVCHHPPISAFYYQGKNYKISGSMELTANIGPNSATGLFLGDIKIQFYDGAWFKAKMLEGEFSGFMIGQNKFETYGTGYVYDNKKLVCSYSTKQKTNNNYQGYIGKLKGKYQQEFFNKIHNSQRFSKFPFFDRKCFQVVYSSMQLVYNSHTSFDGKQYLNLHQQNYLPFLPQNLPTKEFMLLSDSRYRKDIPLRKLNMFEQAQNQKQNIQEQQRIFRKLRAKYDPQHHKSS